MYKVFIASAGIGSRMGKKSQHVNKALVSVAHKPVISHIIEKFSQDLEIVVAAGYKKDSLKQFLSLAYPERKITVVDVDPYEGAGSGLGYSLLCCREYLQCPFIFTSNDTLVIEDVPPPDSNWMGWSKTKDNSQYRTICFGEDNIISQICEKGFKASGQQSYIGLAGIKDYADFWTAMERGYADGAIETGEVYGQRFLLDKGIRSCEFTWLDTGNLASLAEARARLRPANEPNILEKDGEDIWFCGDSVIKFSSDEKFIADRMRRVQFIADYVPKIIASSANMYKMERVKGFVLSEKIEAPLFSKLLEYSMNFWKPVSLNLHEMQLFKTSCMDFYRDKTYSRVELFFKTFDRTDRAERINGIPYPTIREILDKVDWNWIAEGIPVNFHGDFHFENIMFSEKEDKFYFLDWRQNFGGILEYGDIYYDLAKLNHGLIMCHELVNKNLFDVKEDSENIHFDFNRKQSLVECENMFYDFADKKNYDKRKIIILTYIIFLNIAALHHYPYSLLLFYLGKTGLYKALKDIRQ